MAVHFNDVPAEAGTSSRISIIIPVVNEAQIVGNLLKDLIDIGIDGHELIVVDGGSSDSTVEMASRYTDKVIGAPKGRAVQMNAGAAIATRDILWFLHADTRVPANLSDIFLGISDAGRQWGRFDIRLSGKHWLLRIVERMMNLRSRLTGIATGDQGIFVARSLFKAVGGYPDIPLMEDIALSKALKRCSRPVCIKNPRLITSSRRWKEHGIVRTVLLMWRLRLAYALGADPGRLARRYYP